MLGVVTGQAACQADVIFTRLLMKDAADLADALSWISTLTSIVDRASYGRGGLRPSSSPT